MPCFLLASKTYPLEPTASITPLATERPITMPTKHHRGAVEANDRRRATFPLRRSVRYPEAAFPPKRRRRYLATVALATYPVETWKSTKLSSEMTQIRRRRRIRGPDENMTRSV